ncbi:MAG TPA: type III pantothenate kinase [Myxococcota bacterium]|nr:type III pantothenate kinase [Myxococcota bacterium]
MLLVIDVGNTNTVLGLMDDMEVRAQVRMTTRPRTTDEVGIFMLQALAHRGVTPDDVSGAIISSVVPTVLYELQKACRRYLRCEPLVVGRNLKTRIKVRTDNPREVGADRIVNAVAALERWGGPIIIVDFGTATTFDCVNADGEYVGGSIAPGFRISEEALVSKTAKLPRVEVVRPETAIGRNTVTAIQSGLYFGYVGLVDALARRCREELGGQARVVATGGLATLLAADSEVIEEVDPHLTLRGLALLYARNKPASKAPGEVDLL